MTQYRQGDFLLESVDEIPLSATPVARVDGRVIVGEGEATGHHHALADKDTLLFETPAKARFLSVPKEALLVHEEHAPIALPAGNYRVVRQQQYTPAEIVPVSD